MQRSLRSISSAAGLAFLAACAAPPPSIPSNAAVGAARDRHSARALPNDAPPQLLGMHFSSLDVKRGQHWSGEFVTSTNVASLEVRTPLFSLDVPRTSYGHFAFTLDVLDTPPIFIRGYRLEVIARNSAGAQAAEELPFRIQ